MRTDVTVRRMSNLMMVAVVLMAGTNLQAISITPADLDNIILGVSVDNPAGTNLIPSTVGTFDAEVFHGSEYTYVFQMNPTVDNVREILSPIFLKGFNGVAGWSYSEAFAAGGPADGTAWALALTSNDRLRWDLPAQDSASHFFDASESISFFYQSAYGPADVNGNYNLAATGTAGFASGPMPAPEPATLFVMTAAGLSSLLRRRQCRG